MSAKLPPEVLGLVAEHIGADSRKSDLLSLALASRACRVEAQRALFRMVNEHLVGNSDERIMETIKTHNLFLDAILGSPERLAPLVRCYVCIDIATSPVDSEFHSESSFDRSYKGRFDRYIIKPRMRMWNKLCKALPLLTGLTQLTFVANNMAKDSHSRNGVAILRRCQFSLHTLVWENPQDLPALASEFFPRQPGLRSFGLFRNWWDPASSVTNIPMDVLPCLRRIKGDTNTLLSLLPRKNVESISWVTDPEDLDLSDFLRVGPELARVRYLCMSGSEGLNLISQYLGLVEKLCLKTRRRDWDPDFSNFKSLASLRVLILQDLSARDEEWDADGFTDKWSLDTVHIVKAAFEACPTLQQVYIESWQSAFYYTLIERIGDETVADGDVDMSEILDIFDPWMPYAITQLHDFDYYI